MLFFFVHFRITYKNTVDFENILCRRMHACVVYNISDDDFFKMLIIELENKIISKIVFSIITK